MANITKNRIVLTIVWDRDDASNLTYNASARCETPDDKEDAGNEVFNVSTPAQTITRATFRGLTGAQIQTQILGDVDAAIQAIGTGAGGHVLTDDIGDLS